MDDAVYRELQRRCDELSRQLESYRHAETELEQNRLQITRLFNNLPGMVYHCRLDAELNPTLVFTSNGSRELLGLSPEYLVSQQTNVVELMANPDDLRELRETIRQAVLKRSPYKLLYRITLGDGQIKWIWDQGEGVFDANGTPVALEGIMMDISAQKLREYELLQENQRLQNSLGERYRLGNIVGKSHGMREVFKLILRAAKSDANVIILGETGTGKDLVARAIHEQSGSTGPYVAVNCGAIPANLMESEFFGHKKGAFSGATSDTRGYLAAANGGTLFLDEVGEIDLSLQVKLMRALESKLFTQVGSNEPRSSHFRLIAATNRDLGDMVRRGLMRADFFYRLHVLPIHIPPLRKRMEDLPLIVNEFMGRFLGKSTGALPLPASIMTVLENHDWPGNVRELQNVLERYLIFGEVVLSDLGVQQEPARDGLGGVVEQAGQCASLGETMRAVERQLLLKALERNRWKKGRTAKALGLNMRTMQRKLKQYEL